MISYDFIWFPHDFHIRSTFPLVTSQVFKRQSSLSPAPAPSPRHRRRPQRLARHRLVHLRDEHDICPHMPFLAHFGSLKLPFPLFGYGSIPINTIFSGMNIYKSQLFMWTTGVQGFDTLPHIYIIIYIYIYNWYIYIYNYIYNWYMVLYIYR